MTINTYALLQTAVADWLNRSDISATTVRDFITLGENDINRVSRIREQETVTTITIATNPYNSLPSDFLDILDNECLQYTDTLDTLELVSKNTLLQHKSDTSSRPRMFLVGNRIDYDCTPDTTYTATFHYLKKWDLATNTATTDLLTSHPGAYLYCSLAHAEGWLKDDPRIATWKALAQQILDELNNMSNRPKGSVTLRTEISYPLGANIYSG